MLGQLTGEEPLAIVVHPGGGEASDAEVFDRARKAELSTERTLFLVGNRAAFAPLVPSRRILVLTEEELELVREKFGTTFPCRLPFFLLDHERRRGIVVWSASWVGGTLRLDRKGDGWEVRVLSHWIT